MRFIPSTVGPQVADRVPTTLAAFDAKEAHQERAQADKLDQAAHDAVGFRHVLSEPSDLLHDSGSIAVQAYDAITAERWVVALHCKGISVQSGVHADTRFVLWVDADEVRQHARALLVLADHVESLNAERG